MKRLLLLAPMLFLTLAGCNWDVIKDSNLNFNLNSGNINTSSGVDWKLASSLDTFTESEFNDYVTAVQDKYVSESKKSSPGLLDNLSLSDASVESTSGVISPLGESESSAGDDSEQITNVQEQGVDEGDIVKVHGDYLVVLSRGQVFTVRLKENGVPLLKPVFKGLAYAEGFTNGTWYDEMLVQDDMVVVIGYSYTENATQVGLFSFSDDGSVTHQRTFFIDSNDYYSSRNYASRLVNGQLIFYMPYYLFDTYYGYGNSERPDYQLPQIREWIRGNETTPGRDLLKISDIYKPVQDTDSPTLHTVLRCDLTQPTVNCSGKAVLGPYSRTFYVSPSTVYLWVSESYYGSTSDEPDAYAYAMPLDGSGAGVVRAYGTPLDQFSFKESDDGYLNVMVQETGSGDAMWNAEYGDTNIALVRFPLSLFSKEPTVIDKPYYQGLTGPSGYSMQNRFVGDYLVYGSSNYDYYYDDYYYEDGDIRAPDESTVVYVKNYKRTDPVQKVSLASGVERIEVLNNENAVVVGGQEDDLVFSWVNLNDLRSDVVDTYTVNDANQGESRSHGFFYSSSMNILGLPIRKSGSSSYDYLYDESVEVIYLSLDENNFTGLGSLKNSSDNGEFADDCQFSCVDWYGNSRPIFYQDRIFALMGYELVEGKRENDAMTEINRLDIFTGR